MIESINNDKIKYLKHLRDKKFIIKEKKFLVETEHLMIEAINSGYALEIYCTSDFKCNYDIKATIISDNVMRNVSLLESPSKVVCVCRVLKERNLGNKIVMLDNIQDPGNIGTIIRSCVAFGADTIVFGNGTTSIYNEKVIRSSEGNIFHINIIKKEIKEAIKELNNKKIPVIGTSLEKSECLKNEKIEKYGLILGNEGSGVNKEILSMCDKIIRIDISNSCESLNVAVASSIVLYAFRG